MSIPTSTFRFVYYFAKQQRNQFAILMLSFMIWAVNDSVFPYFLKRIVNSVQAYHGISTGVYAAVGGSLALVIIFWAMAEFFMRLQGILQIYTFPRFRARIREAVFDYVKSHSHDYFSSHFSGSLANKLADLPTSCQTILEIIIFQFITVTVGGLVVISTMWFTTTFFAGILILWLCIHMGITLFFLRQSECFVGSACWCRIEFKWKNRRCV